MIGADIPRPQPGDASFDVRLEARIQSNGQRLIGMGAGLGLTFTTAALGTIVPALAPTAGLAILGLPVALVSGWMFAPLVVAAQWRWLPPLVVGLGIAAAFLGWLGVMFWVLLVAMVLTPMSGGASLTAASGVGVAGLVLLIPAALATVPLLAAWALVVRVLAWLHTRM